MKRIGVILVALCCLALAATLWGKKTPSNPRSTVVRPKPPKPPKRPKVQRDSKGRIVTSSFRKPKNGKCATTGAAGPCPGTPVEPAMPKPYKAAKNQRAKTPPPQPVRPAQPSPAPSQPAPSAATGSEAKDPAQ